MRYLIDDEIVVDSDIVVKESLVVDTDIIDGDRVYVDSDVVTPYAVIKEYIPIDIPPTVTPLQIVDYGSSSIECAFDVTTEQAEEVVRGVLCGLENPPTFENADYRLLHGQGNMDIAFAGLQQNTEYYLRPYALSNLGYKYGDVVAQRTKTSLIPDEYQLVEYLQSIGTQYIDLRRTFGRGAVLNTKIRHTTLTSYNTYFGSFSLNLHNILRLRNVNGFGINPCIGSESSIVLYNGINPGVDYEFDIGNFANKITFRMDAIFIQQNVAGNYSQLPCYLFSLNFNGNIDYNHSFIGRMYYANIYEQDVFDSQTVLTNPVFSLYPVYRKADSKPGMYDIVNNQFYVNQGTGEFTVGPDREWQEE